MSPGHKKCKINTHTGKQRPNIGKKENGKWEESENTKQSKSIQKISLKIKFQNINWHLNISTAKKVKKFNN